MNTPGLRRQAPGVRPQASELFVREPLTTKDTKAHEGKLEGNFTDSRFLRVTSCPSWLTLHSFDSCGTMASSRRSVRRKIVTVLLTPTCTSVSSRCRSSTPATG